MMKRLLLIAIIIPSLAYGSDLRTSGGSSGPLSPATSTTLGGVKGASGSLTCSGTDKMNGLAADGSINCTADQSGAGVTGSATVDLGWPAAFEKTFIVNDVNVSSSSKVFAVLSYEDIAGDNMADEITFSNVHAVAGKPTTGNFTVALYSPYMIGGKFKINYSVQ